MSPIKFDHVGIAVHSLEEGKKFYEALGFKQMHIEDVVSEKVRVGMYELANDSRIELLEPLSESSPIKKFLDKKGPGIHHVCLRVENIDQALDNLKAQGFQLVHEQAVKGAHNCRIAFVHPKATGGVLLELSEKGE